MGWALDGPGDRALVAGIGDRDQEALAEVYRRYGGAVWAAAKRVCHRTALAADVCETVFTELWSRPERFDPSRGSLRSWLVAQVHSRAVHAVRTGKAAGSDHDGSTDPTPPSAEVEVAEHVAALAAGARPAVDRLAAEERDAILLTYLGGHSCRETANLLGVSEDTVKSHIRRGLLNLRQASDAEEVTQ